MTDAHFIVAIGASAGGLEALTSFFDHTPLDGVSYVIIPHLSADFKSQMVDILSRHSTLQVLEAAEGMQVEINKVYLIPNTKYMGIKDGRLFLIDKDGQQLPHMTIDAFFTSLAEERRDKAIGVILSGVGTDGSHGVDAIENAGGIIMVQEPGDARFDGMPKAAIAISNTNYIFTALALPKAIQQYVHDEPVTNMPEQTVPTLSKSFVDAVVNLIREQFPFDFTDYKLPTLVRRITRRMVYHKFKSEDAYYDYLRITPAELELLISDFLIGVTSFFRDTDAFKVLEDTVIPAIFKDKAVNGQVKIWVACCATGEEAYSVAILVYEYLLKNPSVIEVRIFATDINKTALDQAAKGVFSNSIENTVSAQRLASYFIKGKDNYKIRNEIRRLLVFARHDLTKNPPYCNVDLISCRNMLIYIKPDLQKQVLAKLSFGLLKDGFLFLGSSENLPIAKDEFVPVSSKWKIYRSTHARRTLRLEGPLTAALNSITLLSPYKGLFKNEPPQPVLLTELTEVILSESGFCGVSVDTAGKVTQSFGDLTLYLKQERFNFNLQQLLPESLAIAYSASVHKVLKLNQQVRLNHIVFTEPGTGKTNQADLVISPYYDKKTKQKAMLVLFKHNDEQLPPNQAGESFSIDGQTKDYIFQLEEERLQNQVDLQTSNELLESSKETMQSFNEELLSANEEMQSANEELQSINEELESINSEYKMVIQELTVSNDDLNNYFRSNINGQLFVDNDILLKKYSPGAVKHINIKDRDIGRPLSNITTNIKFETIIDDIRMVIGNGEIIIREIESNENRTYQVMTSPYIKKTDKTIYGAIITFYDITELKKTQRELDSSNKMLRLAMESAEMGTWSMHMQTRELISSSRLKELFGFNAGEEMSLKGALAQITAEYRESVKQAVEQTLKSGDRFDMDFSVNAFNGGPLRWVKAIGKITHDHDIKPGYFTGIMHDITEQKMDDLRKNDFIAIASHELKTPLTSLQAMVQMLNAKAKKTDDQFTNSVLDRALLQIKKMTTLIGSFLNVSRLESGKIYLNKENFKVFDLLNEAVQEITLTNTTHHIVLLPCTDITIHADKDKIGQVINNLLTNAIKYSPRGKNIEVACSVTNGCLQVSVQDEGMGIKPQDQDKLFDRFYRIDNAHTQMISGFGIGLYLSAEIIQRHNGKIWVESEKAVGSTFYFSLPL